MAGCAGRRRHRAAGPGKGGEGKGTRRSCGSKARGRRGVGGSSGATGASFKPATSDDAATRSSPAELEAARSRAARRGLEGGEPARRGGGRAGRVGSLPLCAAQRGACALHATAPRPPATWARPRPTRPPAEWELGVLAAF